MNPPTNFSSYLLPSVFNPRYHQHLSHLNDMAFTHTKMLQEIIEKRSVESSNGSSSSQSSSPTSSVSPLAATSNDSTQQQKRSHSFVDTNNNEERNRTDFPPKRSKIDKDEDENHANKRSRKQSKPQQLLKETNPTDEEPSEASDAEADEETNDEEQEMGEVVSQHEKPVFLDRRSLLDAFSLCP